MSRHEETLALLADRAEELGCLPAAELLRRGGRWALHQAWCWRQSRDGLLEQLALQAWAEAPEELRSEVLTEAKRYETPSAPRARRQRRR